MKLNPLVRKPLVLDESMTRALIAGRKLQTRLPLEDALTPPTVYAEKPAWLRVPNRAFRDRSNEGLAHLNGWLLPDMGAQVDPPWRPGSAWTKFTAAGPPSEGWYWVRWADDGLEHLLFLRRVPNEHAEHEAEKWNWRTQPSRVPLELLTQTSHDPWEMSWRDPGTFLYVSEPAKVVRLEPSPVAGDPNPRVVLRYAATGEELGVSWPMRLPAPRRGRTLSTPMEVSRFWLEVSAVALEQVQDISLADAKAMGLACITKDGGRTWKWGVPDRDGLPGTDNLGWPWAEWDVDARKAFFTLWDKYHELSAEFNPWAWAGTFRRLDDTAGLRLRLARGEHE